MHVAGRNVSCWWEQCGLPQTHKRGNYPASPLPRTYPREAETGTQLALFKPLAGWVQRWGRLFGHKSKESRNREVAWSVSCLDLWHPSQKPKIEAPVNLVLGSGTKKI